MRIAKVYCNRHYAGELIEINSMHYVFRYDEDYFRNPDLPSISLTLPKTKLEYTGKYIFPFFSNMVAEGTNLSIQEHYLKIDERDIMRLLGATASKDSIGAVTVELIS